LLLPFIAATLIGTTVPSVSQVTPQLEQLQVDLWSEYDRPEMLVIYRGTLSAETPLPTTLTLRLPARIGEPHAVAYDDGTGSLLEANYTSTASGDWLLVTLETPSSNFQLEYYDALSRTDERRHYTFIWPGDYAVDQLSLQLLPPPDATEILTEPALSPARQDSGLLVYGGLFGRTDVEQEVQLAVSYRGTPAGVPRDEPRAARESENRTLIYAGGVVATLLLALGGGIWYTRRQTPALEELSARPRRAKRSRRERRRAQSKKRPSVTVEEEPLGTRPRTKPSSAGYCTACGRPLQAEDRFCGGCGKPVTKD
jgi:hypothetical protein